MTYSVFCYKRWSLVLCGVLAFHAFQGKCAEAAPLTVSELLRKAYVTLNEFESLELTLLKGKNRSVERSKAWFMRPADQGEMIVRTEEFWKKKREEISRVFLQKDGVVYRFRGDMAWTLLFPMRLPKIGKLPPTHREYERVLNRPTELQYFEISEIGERRGRQCYLLTYRAPAVDEKALRRDAEAVKARTLKKLEGRKLTDDEQAKAREFDYLASVKRGKVAVRVFYISSDDYFTFGWEYYNDDGEMLSQLFYDDYSINGEMDTVTFEIGSDLERLEVSSKREYNLLLHTD